MYSSITLSTTICEGSLQIPGFWVFPIPPYVFQYYYENFWIRGVPNASQCFCMYSSITLSITVCEGSLQIPGFWVFPIPPHVFQYSYENFWIPGVPNVSQCFYMYSSITLNTTVCEGSLAIPGFWVFPIPPHVFQYYYENFWVRGVPNASQCFCMYSSITLNITVCEGSLQVPGCSGCSQYLRMYSCIYTSRSNARVHTLVNQTVEHWAKGFLTDLRKMVYSDLG